MTRRIHSHFFLLPLLCLVLLTSIAPAQETLPTDGTKPPTRIEVDEQAHLVRIVIEGKEVAVIDRDGMRIDGNVKYTGLSIKDTGRSQATGNGEAK